MGAIEASCGEMGSTIMSVQTRVGERKIGSGVTALEHSNEWKKLPTYPTKVRACPRTSGYPIVSRDRRNLNSPWHEGRDAGLPPLLP